MWSLLDNKPICHSDFSLSVIVPRMDPCFSMSYLFPWVGYLGSKDLPGPAVLQLVEALQTIKDGRDKAMHGYLQR